MSENIGKMAHTAGVVLKYSTTGAAHTFVKVEDLVSIDPGEMQVGDIPSSSLSTLEQIIYTKGGWIDLGQATFRIGLTASKFTALYTYFRTRPQPELWWLIVLPPEYQSNTSMGRILFKARISSFKPAQSMEREQNENVMADMRLKITQGGNAQGDMANYFAVGTGTV